MSIAFTPVYTLCNSRGGAWDRALRSYVLGFRCSVGALTILAGLPRELRALRVQTVPAHSFCDAQEQCVIR